MPKRRRKRKGGTGGNRVVRSLVENTRGTGEISEARHARIQLTNRIRSGQILRDEAIEILATELRENAENLSATEKRRYVETLAKLSGLIEGKGGPTVTVNAPVDARSVIVEGEKRMKDLLDRRAEIDRMGRSGGPGGNGKDEP